MDPAEDLAAELAGLPGRQEYLRAAAEMLARIFPGIGVGWASLDPRTGEAEVANFPDEPSVNTAMFRKLYQDHPLVVGYLRGAADHSGILRMSDLISDRALRETQTYREALSPVGVDRQFAIRTTLRGSPTFRAWAVVRNKVDFSDAELDLAATVQQMLRLLDLAYGGPPTDAGRQERAEAQSLTAREFEILQVLGKGLTGVAIGHLLGVSPRTVAKHLEHAYAKLGCTNRIDALRRVRGE